MSLTRLLRPAAVMAAGLFAAMYLFTALPRLFYSYDLDFIEDSMLMESIRFAEGRPVFAPPNADFAPHVYMPLYSWIGGMIFKITGPSFLPLRLLSFGAVLLTAALLYRIARRESGQAWIGFVCAGLYLGGYRITGFWYELARVDSLFVALSLIGLSLGIYAGKSRLRLMLAALALASAFYCKQTALAYAAGLGLYLVLALGRRAWWFIVPVVLLIVAPLMTGNRLSSGWFVFHTFTVAAADPVKMERAVHFLWPELLGTMGALSLSALAAAALAFRPAKSAEPDRSPWFVAIGIAVLISGVGRASAGGNLNNLMSAYTLLCLAPALLWRHGSGKWREPLIAVAVLLQFVSGVYNPVRYIPTAEMREAGDRLIRRIAAIDGEVLVGMHPYYAVLAGKRPSAQIATIWYAYALGGLPLPADFVGRLEGRYYAAIISDESLFETDPAIRNLIVANYVESERLPAAEAPPTMSGMVVRPRLVYVPRQLGGSND